MCSANVSHSHTQSHGIDVLCHACAVLLALLREAEDDDVNCVLSKLVQLYPDELVPHAETLTHHLVCGGWELGEDVIAGVEYRVIVVCGLLYTTDGI